MEANCNASSEERENNLVAAAVTAAVNAGACRKKVGAVAHAAVAACLGTATAGQRLSESDDDEIKDRASKLEAAVRLHRDLDRFTGKHEHNLGRALATARQKGLVDPQVFASGRRTQRKANQARHDPFDEARQASTAVEHEPEGEHTAETAHLLGCAKVEHEIEELRRRLCRIETILQRGALDVWLADGPKNKEPTAQVEATTQTILDLANTQVTCDPIVLLEFVHASAVEVLVAEVSSSTARFEARAGSVSTPPSSPCVLAVHCSPCPAGLIPVFPLDGFLDLVGIERARIFSIIERLRSCCEEHIDGKQILLQEKPGTPAYGMQIINEDVQCNRAKQVRAFEMRSSGDVGHDNLQKALHRCKEVLSELMPEVLRSSALAGFESMSDFDVIGSEMQVLFAQKAQALRELAQAGPQLMSYTASEALVVLRQGGDGSVSAVGLEHDTKQIKLHDGDGYINYEDLVWASDQTINDEYHEATKYDTCA